MMSPHSEATNDAILNSIITTGDLSRLSPEQKVDYYRTFCEKLGLDPISQPFKLLRLNGREILYCDRTGAQQLNKLHNVSHEIKAREIVNGCYVVTAQASTPDGRHTESIGAVPIEGMKGDNLCNAMMKAETKSKRRSTLDLLGLGILDETEADVIAPASAKLPAPVRSDAEAPLLPPPDPNHEPPVFQIFKTKYDTSQKVEATLKKALTIEDLANLYYFNIPHIEKDVALKALFTARKLQITNKAAAEKAGTATAAALNKKP